MFIWRLFLVLLLLTVLRWILGYFTSPPPRKVRTGGQGQVTKSSKRMVKDPQCGMYVAEELALQTRNAHGIMYFCSKECQQSYAKAQLLKG